MKLLLDTCTLIWLAAEPSRLSARAANVLEAADSVLHLSDVSVLEICMKWQANKLVLPAPPRLWVEEQRRIWDVAPAALTTEHMYRATELPLHHRDPFDRLLVAQAITAGLTVVTPDAAITAYPVATIW
jgi:PIN domain nuclease of toxin-antitoxin system